MHCPILSFVNNKGGTGKTFLVFHLAWALAALGKKVLVVDLDPQANLTASFLEDHFFENIRNKSPQGATIWQCVLPLMSTEGIADPNVKNIAKNLWLLPGDANLQQYEPSLSAAWCNSMGERNLGRQMQIIVSFWQTVKIAATKANADLVLMDTNSGLSAITRSTCLASDYFIFPLEADRYSMQGLQNFGIAIAAWQQQWQKRLLNWENSSEKKDFPNFSLPNARMQPIGWLQTNTRNAMPEWEQKMSSLYFKFIGTWFQPAELCQDANCLGNIPFVYKAGQIMQEYKQPMFNFANFDRLDLFAVKSGIFLKNQFIALAKTVISRIL